MYLVAVEEGNKVLKYLKQLGLEVKCSLRIVLTATRNVDTLSDDFSVQYESRSLEELH